MAIPQRQVRLTVLARHDVADILEWTAERFGSQQAATYADALAAAIMRLARDTGHASARKRDDIKPGLRSLHLAAVQPRARHLIFFRVADDGSIAVTRVLHDSMDLRGRFEDDV